MNTLDVLITARQLITKRENWVQHIMARDIKGHRVSPWNPGAVCFCALGAIQKAEGFQQRLGQAARRTLNMFVPNNIADFNDNPYRTHEEVLALFDRAIKYEQDWGVK